MLLELARTERSAGARASTPSVPFILSGPRGPWFERPGSSKGTDLDAVRSTLRPNGVERKAPARTSPSWRQPPCRDQEQTETPLKGGEARPHPAGRALYPPPTPPEHKVASATFCFFSFVDDLSTSTQTAGTGSYLLAGAHPLRPGGVLAVARHLPS